MRHLRNDVKLGRTSMHRKHMLANLVCSLIERSQVRTTVAKAKAARPLAEKCVTLGKKGTLHHRRRAVSILRQKAVVKRLFSEIAPRFQQRNGGYTRIVKLGPRVGDAAEMALLEWVEGVADAAAEKDEKQETKSKQSGAGGKTEKKTEATAAKS
jgi:large subunit ribosomal protein L17